MTATEPTSATPSPALARALRAALRPLIKVMLAQGVTLAYVTELLKSLMVDVAQTDFPLERKAATDSRISLMTGVHRKDVSRLRTQLSASQEHTPKVVSLGAQLVAVWVGSPLYLDEQGEPMPLPRFVSEGGEVSFEALVASVNSDIRSRVVLDEWLRLGVVHFDDAHRVCLNTQAFVPSEGFEEKAYYFGHNLHDHAAAAAHNLLGGAPMMERSVQYDALSPASIALLAKQSQDMGMKALLAVNKSALACEQRDAVTQSPRQRMTFGVYFYSEPMPSPEARVVSAPLAATPLPDGFKTGVAS
ncbi:DUF6502 family protein [Rhodoferax sp.]|uniref:DUF6502 family protein n=1 Tax=Rhodoferax sp. TaxID=50421 RepID=UPI002607C271|nr:DUF6502 family protein [Rhodoferax sp.]MDD2810673.1 DUF6502 family protein [Rhodoferax sp.]MDD4944319.1 DUF6502 family protein [Rhodoferax sp.]MDD5479609.1 DUF6502 family protein [Rhodoferax sp.]